MGDLSAGSRRIGFLLDVLIILIGFRVTYAILQLVLGHPIFRFNGAIYFGTYLLITIAWGVSLLFAGEYPTRRSYSFLYEVLVTLRVGALGVLFFTTLAFLLKLNGFSRLFLGSYFVVTAILMTIERWGIRACLGVLRAKGRDQRTRLVVGGGPRARRYIQQVDRHPERGLRVIGYLSDLDASLPASRLGGLADLRQTLTTHPVDAVVVTLPVTHAETESILAECELHGIPVELLLDSFSSRINASELVSTMGIPRLLISTLPHTAGASAWKRATDFVVSGCLLLLLSPVMAAIALAIKLDDGGPVLYAQERVGLHGRRFRMHKFRSMVVDADRMKDQLRHLNEMSGPVFKIRDDPRVTRVGRFLRRTSLDELPQLWDVFVGNMSLVGPRPPLPDEVDMYDIKHRRRLSVKPGITFLWQISGRNNIDFDQWMELDLQYIDNWSYLEDWKILFKTIPAVLRREGAS
ncbi:MAG: sugar transferase [Alicyclobacillus macrosporangiidus]|uniref:sugar transferase n=1 Tax=Alicyclobacillus macrosporangiidus TaxID=392015 RepID=UPI0026EECE44|nr:sugar transferase [Alicyclobacillus macrosporangiidus]MCL6598829.1 sugar transferase [Alicyclobacillus macrosporangiidus]